MIVWLCVFIVCGASHAWPEEETENKKKCLKLNCKHSFSFFFKMKGQTLSVFVWVWEGPWCSCRTLRNLLQPRPVCGEIFGCLHYNQKAKIHNYALTLHALKAVHTLLLQQLCLPNCTNQTWQNWYYKIRDHTQTVVLCRRHLRFMKAPSSTTGQTSPHGSYCSNL